MDILCRFDHSHLTVKEFPEIPAAMQALRTGGSLSHDADDEGGCIRSGSKQSGIMRWFFLLGLLAPTPYHVSIPNYEFIRCKDEGTNFMRRVDFRWLPVTLSPHQ